MKKRWNLKNFLGATKRGVLSVVACAFVLSPVIAMGMQLSNVIDITPGDSRKVVAAEPLAVRQADAAGGPLRPFGQPIITVTFDDGWESIYTDGLPLLQKYGIPTTQYVMSGYFDNGEYMTMDQIKSLQGAGHEISCHTIDHSDLTKLPAAAVEQQLQHCRQTFEPALGRPVRHFASPYGSDSPATIEAIKRHYATQRNTEGDIIKTVADDKDVNLAANFDRYHIVAVTLRRDTTVQQLQQAIDYAVKHNGWLVLNYHDVSDSDSEFGVNRSTLEAHMRAVNTSPARVATIGQVMDAIDAANSRNGNR